MQTNSIQNPSAPDESRLVSESTLIAAIFGNAEDAFSPRTLRDLRRARIIPYFKIGRLVRYDVTLVRAALERHCLVQRKEVVK